MALKIVGYALHPIVENGNCTFEIVHTNWEGTQKTIAFANDIEQAFELIEIAKLLEPVNG